MTNIHFTFQTESDYHKARQIGYIDNYQMARIKVLHSAEGFSDFPVHSAEEMKNCISKLDKAGSKYEVYQSSHYYDISEYMVEDFD